jgi:hypothetical protein
MRGVVNCSYSPVTRVDHQQRVVAAIDLAAMRAHDRLALAVNGRHNAAVVADGYAYAMVHEAIAEIDALCHETLRGESA